MNLNFTIFIIINKNKYKIIQFYTSFKYNHWRSGGPGGVCYCSLI